MAGFVTKRTALLLIGLSMTNAAFAVSVGPVERSELPATGSILIVNGSSLGALTIGANLALLGGVLSATASSVTSVAGRTGSIMLSNTDISGLSVKCPCSHHGGSINRNKILAAPDKVCHCLRVPEQGHHPFGASHHEHRLERRSHGA